MEAKDVWSEFLEGADLRKKQEQAFRESVSESQVALLIESLEEWPDRRALLKLGLTSEEMRQFWSNRGNAELAALAVVVKSYKTPARFTAAVMRIRFSEPMNAEALFNRIIRGNRIVQQNYESVTSPNLISIKKKLNSLSPTPHASVFTLMSSASSGGALLSLYLRGARGEDAEGT